MTVDAPAPQVTQYQPTQQEILAQQAAENDRITAVQDRLRTDSERLFRLFGARSALAGSGSPLGRSM